MEALIFGICVGLFLIGMIMTLGSHDLSDYRSTRYKIAKYGLFVMFIGTVGISALLFDYYNNYGK